MMENKIKNQLRKCNICDTVWQTIEKDGILRICPNCGSGEYHIPEKNRIFTSHLITQNDYDNLLLNTTWHETFRNLKGNYLIKKYCDHCKNWDKSLDYCGADICSKFKQIKGKEK
jgi:predicted  nucleic acid-binding Zn-ribbon protein